MANHSISIWKKIAFAAVVCIVFFAAIELVLWMSGVKSIVQREDPSRGFSQLVSVYQRQGDQLRTRPTEGYQSFNDQTFAAKKPDNGLRIFCLGGSSAYGFPWDARASFSGILQDVLAESYPERTVECVNAAGMSYAMHRLQIVAREVIQYDPDLLIVYSGHNEFVEPAFYRALKERSQMRQKLDHFVGRSRLFTLAKNLREDSRKKEPEDIRTYVRRNEDVSYSDEQKKKIVDDFESGLRAIVEMADQNDVHVLVATVPCNLSDWRPEKSKIVRTGDSDLDSAWREAFQNGSELLESNDYQASAQRFAEAKQIDADHAELNFLLGQAQEGLGQWEAARESFQLACDLDVSPIRRLTSINESIKKVANETDATLVDVDFVFQQESENGLVGLNLIEDYVHPTREGHEIIARHLWMAIEDAEWFSQPGIYEPSLFDAVVASRTEAVPTESASWFFNQGVVLQKQQHIEQAVEKYKQALVLDPDYPAAHNNLGDCLLQLGQVGPAIEHFRNVLQLDPRSVQTRNQLAIALASIGEMEQALQQYQDALQVDPDSTIVRLNFGYALHRIGMLHEAEHQFQEAIKIDSDLENAYLGLGVIAQTKGDHERAIEFHRQALELDPGMIQAGLNIAWIQATSPDDNLRDGASALQIAMKATEATNDQNPFILEVLAASYAETGQFSEAVETARRALELVHPESPQAAQIQQRIQLYSSEKPLRLGKPRKG